MAKQKIDKKAFKYEGKTVQIHQEGDKVYLTPINNKKTEKSNVKKGKNGSI